MIDRKHDLPVTRKCQLLGLNRFYNRERRHQSLNRQTPDQAYEGSVMWPTAA